MKKTATYMIPILLVSMTAMAQAPSETEMAMAKKSDTVKDIYPEPLKEREDVKWKEENVTVRRSEYGTKATFDPAAEYSDVWNKYAASGSIPKTETGKAKLLNDNNAAPTVYYNKATVGTIIKLNNPENGKSTFAIVVGKVPPVDSQVYMLMLSDKAAHNLSIKDYSSIELVCFSDTMGQ